MQASLTAERVPVASLTPYPGNPRRGDVDAIRESLRTNGQFRPIVVDRPTMQVLAGNHTLRAAKKLGWTEIAVTYVDVDDERAKRIVLADNRTNDLAGYDPAELVSLLTDLPSLEGTGYDEAALDELLDEVGPTVRGGVRFRRPRLNAALDVRDCACCAAKLGSRDPKPRPLPRDLGAHAG
jgi:hypothetical protein